MVTHIQFREKTSVKLTEKLTVLLFESVKDAIKKHFKVADGDFEKADPNHCVCSIAKTKEGWVGFSHRAAHEFKKGDKLFDETWNDNGKLSEKDLEKIKFKERGSITIESDEQAKQAAKNFAAYVS